MEGETGGNAGFQPALRDLKGRVTGDGPRGWHHRGYLPHFDGGELTQHVTMRLADSLPESILQAIREEVQRERDHPGRSFSQSEADLRVIQLAEAYLDKGHGSCPLANPQAAEIVQNALKYFDGSRYRLHQWCEMPNHVHILFTPIGTEQLGKILHSWKSFTSNRINAILGRSGQLWMFDYFDRYMRNEVISSTRAATSFRIRLLPDSCVWLKSGDGVRQSWGAI